MKIRRLVQIKIGHRQYFFVVVFGFIYFALVVITITVSLSNYSIYYINQLIKYSGY